jgi:hypothetical protein
VADPTGAEAADEATVPEPVDETRARARRYPDLIMLMVGLVSLATATFAIVGYLPPFPSFDPRWLLAGGAALVGLLLLIVSVRGPRESGDS